MDPIVRQVVESSVHLLAEGEYGALAAMTGDNRLTEEQLRAAVGGRSVRPLAPGWTREAPVVPVVGTARPVLVVTVDLPVDGEPRLSMRLTLTEVGTGLWETQIDGVHVR